MAGYWAHGTRFRIGGVFVGGLTNIGFPERSRGDVRTTDHDSGGDEEFAPGLRDNGNVSLTARDLPEDPGQLALLANLEAVDDVVLMEIISPPQASPNGTIVRSFMGYVNGTGGDAPGDSNDPASTTYSIRVSGAVIGPVVVSGSV